ncbi:MAG: hypothetical protein JW951_09550 [Lentisphaerae bacterium]|nr:hypothetical protein [Lentisphaerota bacterium]
MKKLMVIGFCIVAILAGLTALLPALLSTDGGRACALGLVNRRIEGEVAVDDWRLKWRDGVRLKNVRVEHPASGTEAVVREIDMSAGLLGLVGSMKHIGTLRVIEPVLRIAQTETKPEAGPGGAASGRERGGAAGPDRGAPGKTSPARGVKDLGFDLDGTLEIRGGRLELMTPRAAGPIRAEAVNLNVGIKSLREPVAFDVDVASPLGRVEVAGSLDLAAAGRLPRGTLSGKAVIQVPAAAEQFRELLGLREDVAVREGTIHLDVALDASADAVTGKAGLRTEGIKAAVGGRPVALDAPIVLDLRGGWDKGGPRIEQASLTSSFATLTGTGTLDDMRLALAADLDKAAAEAGKFFTMEGIRLAGKADIQALVTRAGPSQADIAVDGTLTNLWLEAGGWGLRDPGMVIKARLRLDLPKDMLDFGPVSVTGRHLEGACTGSVHELSASPLLDAGLNASASGETLTAVLGLAHPLLRQSAVISGRLNARIPECRIPFGEALRTGTRVNGVLDLERVVLVPQGVLADLLRLAELGGERVAIPDQSLNIRCLDGRVFPDPVTLRADAYELVLNGTVGLDGTLDYTAEVPLTEALVGARAYPFLKDTRLKIPVGGHVTHPRLGDQAFRAAVGSLARDALRNVIREQGGKLLDLLQR